MRRFGLIALPLVVAVALAGCREASGDGVPAKDEKGPRSADGGTPPPAKGKDEKDAPVAARFVGFGGDQSLGRNLANFTEKGILDTFDTRKGKQKNVKWQAALGDHAYGGPVISGGRVYVGTNNSKPRDDKIEGDKGVLMCFDEKDGKFLWQIVHDKIGDDDQDAGKQGVLSVPFVEGERLWYLSNRCEFVCADAVKGKIVWSVDMRKEYGVFPNQATNSSPVVVGDVVYALTCNGMDIHKGKLPAPKAPSLLALDKKTGKLAWKFVVPSPIIHGQWSSPSAAKVGDKWQIIIAAGDNWVYGLSADKGELLWKFNLNIKKETPYKRGGAGEQSMPIGVPVVVDGRCYVTVGQEPDDGQGVGHLWCIDITKKPAGPDKDISPADGDLDPRSPKNKTSGLLWHYGGLLPKDNEDNRPYNFGRTMTTVCVHDGVVYASELAGFFHALDAKTGEKLWQHDLNESTWCSPYYVDGKVFVGTDSGELYVFKPGRKKAEPKKITVGQPIKVPPVAANGVLYLNTQIYLFAIK